MFGTVKKTKRIKLWQEVGQNVVPVNLKSDAVWASTCGARQNPHLTNVNTNRASMDLHRAAVI